MIKCSNCKTPARVDNPVQKDGLCDHCHVDARNSLREKLRSFLGDPSNFSYEEWLILYDLKGKILTLW